MSTKYKTGDNQIPHFITFAVVEWIDGLTRNEYKDIIVDSLKYCSVHKGLIMHAWIIMSNHVHLIMSSCEGFEISNILRDMKRHTSKAILNAIQENPQESRKEWMMRMFEKAGRANANNEKFQFWQQDNHPIELATNIMIDQRLDYLHDNPVRAGIVYEPQGYVYSSAVDYYTEKKGMIALEYI